LTILHINHWHLTVPVLMLWFGWAGVIATARFLWWAGIAMASDVGSDADAMDVSASRLRELLDEKKILVRAIKEIEFDRDLGKMSAEDAKDVMRFYRARAIEVIKEIDGQDESDMTVPQRIERDLQARLALQSQPLRGGKESPPQRAARIIAARANAKAAADAKAAAEAAESESESKAEAPADESAEESAEESADESVEEAKADASDGQADDKEKATAQPKQETPASSEDDETEAAESA
jgi:hypothetical protein